MKWILIFLITSLCSGQVTLTEQESIQISKKVQNLQIEVDSLKNIVNLQNKLIYIHKEVIFSDSTLTLKLEEKVDVLENDVKLLEKKTKLVKPSWYEINGYILHLAQLYLRR